ncbi:MAG: hypothetical protein ACKOQP_03030, partial [Bacteroidota bacterium]
MNFIHRLIGQIEPHIENDPDLVFNIQKKLNDTNRWISVLKNQKKMIETQIENYQNLQNELTNQLMN